MSGHALEVLEFERVLERIARRASSEMGRKRVLDLEPRSDREGVERELARVAATMRFVEARPDWGLGVVPDVRSALRRLGAEGAVLEPLELHGVRVLLVTSRLLEVELRTRDVSASELTALRERLVDLGPLEQKIGRAVDEEGSVLSSASRELKRIRSQLRGAHSKIVRELESYLRTLPERFVVSDASVTIREGRYVIPLRREGKGEVGGIVHDESQTGATLYVEPPVAIDLMNRLRDLEREEAREVRRILGELTASVAPERHAIRGALEALVDFDSLDARARAARAWDAEPPELSESDEAGLRIREGRHPLLVEAPDEPVVPFDLELAAHERALVVSGPNTGGKSVFLKACGLITTLAQSGVVPPVGPGTRLPVFGSFFADIGDEQSIARNLSTFSAHLRNLRDIVEQADASSLVLIDEMGTGTDPAEGAALARAVLEELVSRGATTLVSSHLSELKQLDREDSGVVNASLQFDAERMEPTYRLVKGRPGRSYGLAIARRLGFPGRVLDRAEAYREDGARQLEDVLARLERQESAAGEAAVALERQRVRVARLEAEVEEREAALAASEASADDRARRRARELLLEARSEVEEAIRELRDIAGGEAALDEAAHEARRRVEEAAQRHVPRPGPTETGAPADVTPGDPVRIKATGSSGKVIELRDDRALVEAGALRLEVSLSDLERGEVAEADGGESRRGRGWTGPAVDEARLEVDLRGLRVDEMEPQLTRALDEAVLSDLAELRIIHGKGTGALRKRVGEMLEQDSRVSEFRMGGPTEGGAGVTVASFGASG